MADAPEGTEGSEGTQGQQGGESAEGDSSTSKPINLTQEEFNRQLSERVKRERAKFSDYNDLKAKASRLAEIEEANKSEIDRALDRVTKAEQEAAQVPAKVADALKVHLAALHKISDEDAELFLTANTPELLLKQVDRLTAREAARQAEADAAAAEAKKRGNRVPREGTSTTAPEDDERETLRRLFGGD